MIIKYDIFYFNDNLYLYVRFVMYSCKLVHITLDFCIEMHDIHDKYEILCVMIEYKYFIFAEIYFSYIDD